MNFFNKATIQNIKIRMALIGPAGSGKTYSALAIAKNLANPVAVIDSERGSSRKYAEIFDFSVHELTNYSIGSYITAIKEAEKARFGTLIIDGISQAWNWELDEVNKERNSFAGWAKMRPLERAFVDAITKSPCHIIATIRSKTLWEVEENEHRKKVPKKVGVGPVQSSGIEFEFDIVGQINDAHLLTIDKSRCPQLQDCSFLCPGKDVAVILNQWIGEPWRNWNSEDDAIEYAVSRNPSLSKEEVKNRLEAIPAKNGVRAINIAREIQSWNEETDF